MQTVLIADDQEVARAGLREILRTASTVSIVAEVPRFDEVLSAVDRFQPSVVLLDIRWGTDQDSAIALIGHLRNRTNAPRIVAMSALDSLMLEARRAGADMVLGKGFSRDELLAAIQGISRPRDGRVAEWLSELQSIAPGKSQAREYERLIAKALPTLLGAHLTEFSPQRRTAGGRQVWDIVALNSSRSPFWQRLVEQHRALQIVIECKNVGAVTAKHVAQVAHYLLPPLSQLGFIFGRQSVESGAFRQAVGFFRETGCVVLLLDDGDLRDMCDLYGKGEDAGAVVQAAYLALTRESRKAPVRRNSNV